MNQDYDSWYDWDDESETGGRFQELDHDSRDHISANLDVELGLGRYRSPSRVSRDSASEKLESIVESEEQDNGQKRSTDRNSCKSNGRNPASPKREGLVDKVKKLETSQKLAVPGFAPTRSVVKATNHVPRVVEKTGVTQGTYTPTNGLNQKKRNQHSSPYADFDPSQFTKHYNISDNVTTSRTSSLTSLESLSPVLTNPLSDKSGSLLELQEVRAAIKARSLSTLPYGHPSPSPVPQRGRLSLATPQRTDGQSSVPLTSHDSALRSRRSMSVTSQSSRMKLIQKEKRKQGRKSSTFSNLFKRQSRSESHHEAPKKRRSTLTKLADAVVSTFVKTKDDTCSDVTGRKKKAQKVALDFLPAIQTQTSEPTEFILTNEDDSAIIQPLPLQYMPPNSHQARQLEKPQKLCSGRYVRRC